MIPPLVHIDMDLNPRLLAFLEHEMKKIKNDKNRRSEIRHNASSVLGRVEADLEMEHKKHAESNIDTDELFAK